MKSRRILYQLIVLLIIPFWACIRTSAVELDVDKTVTHFGTFYYQLEEETEYAFLVVKEDADESIFIDTDNLLYIDQQKSDTSGTVSFMYLPKELVPLQTILRGENYENAKEVTWYFSNEGTLTVLGTGEIPSFDDAPWSIVEESVTKLVITGSVSWIGANAFESCSNLTTIVFEGDAPVLDPDALAGITATAYFPEDNATWTEDVLQNYGGAITWDSRHLPGDINGDGEVNNKDVTRLFQYLSDWDVEVDEAALDVNGDGEINNKDLTRLFQYLSDWDVEIF